MSKRQLVQLLAELLPAALFTHLRRGIALCRYNYHSAVRTPSQKADSGFPADVHGTCLHCQALIHRDRDGQWREVPLGLFKATESA